MRAVNPVGPHLNPGGVYATWTFGLNSQAGRYCFPQA